MTRVLSGKKLGMREVGCGVWGEIGKWGSGEVGKWGISTKNPNIPTPKTLKP
jgi:hypothetical protein